MRLTGTLLRPVIETFWLGRTSYGGGLVAQNNFIEKLISAKEHRSASEHRNYLLLLEHTPVYTVGLRSHIYSEEEETRLKQLGADFYRTDRGGLITYHGPGQLVAYPIMDLASLSVRHRDSPSVKVGVRRYVYLIEEAVIQSLAHFGLSAGRSSNTGVWLGNGSRKIAAIGIHVRQGLTSHGLALNCNTDLKWFHEIVPCGIPDKKVTSLSLELGRDVPIAEAIWPFCESFESIFQSELRFRTGDFSPPQSII